MLTIYDGGGNFIKYDVMNFSGGEVHFRLKNANTWKVHPKIVAHLLSSNDVMELLMATDALKRSGYTRIELICPYCTFLRPNCMCAISTRVSNDNENKAENVSRIGN